MSCGGSERPRMLRIARAADEAKDIRTFWFKDAMSAAPGQFVMAWLPGAGLKPFGISYMEEGGFGITFKRVGPFTEKLSALGEGDRVGIQGPYGRGFSFSARNAVLVGGGHGAAPLAFLAEELLKRGCSVTLVIGAPSAGSLLYRKRFSGSGIRMMYMTDDGSFGRKGFCSDCLEELLAGGKADRVYACGPEKMMAKIFGICEREGVPAEFSLDRYMKCGFGICGSCVLDGTGWRVCKEGPVFTLEELRKVPDFGKWKRDPSGRKVGT